MREVLVRELPGVAVLAGTAEEIPLPDASVDVVLVGQAFHWFDPARAPKEIVRVLRPGGGLVAIWNVRNESEGWTDQVRDLLDRHKGDTPRHSDDRWRQGIDASGLFAPIELRLFDHAQQLPREEAVETYGSRSYVAAMPEGERAALLREVAAILPDEPMVTIPYTTQVYWTRRSP
jgi:SAM-dependent methyltransferase